MKAKYGDCFHRERIMNQKLNDLWEKYYKKVYDIRHQIHMNPELGFEEYETSKLVSSELEKLGIEVTKNVVYYI